MTDTNIDDTLAFVHRVEAAIKRLDGSMLEFEEWHSIVAEWRDCVTRHGPGSASENGCLLALVRIALGDSAAHVYVVGGLWAVVRGDRRVAHASDKLFAGSESEALVLALEAAP